MRRASGFSTGALAFGCALGLAHCDRHGGIEGSRPTPVAAKPPAAASRAPIAPSEPAPSASADVVDSLSVSELPDDESAAPLPSSDAPRARSKLVIDDAVVVAPAGQMAADASSVVMIDRNDELHVAKRAALSSSPHPERARFAHISGGPNDFFAVARGPLLLRGKAYWVRDGKLVRRVLDGSAPLEILATDARNGTRVAGADVAGAPAHALYVTRPKMTTRQRARVCGSKAWAAWPCRPKEPARAAWPRPARARICSRSRSTHAAQ